MKFIQLHAMEDNSPFYLNMQNAEKMEWVSKKHDGYTTIKMMNKVVYSCKETSIEILQKIAEAEPHGQTVGDVVRVIRCKDCKHHINGGCWNKEGRHTFVSDMDFCSRGERKEETEC